jgi:ABC-2 type transport system permease protein
MSAIYILWLRELKRYFRSRVQIIVSLGQPALYLLALGFGFGPVFAKAGAGNYLQFMAPGVVGMTVLFSSVISGIAMLWDRQFGFLKETLVAPVSRLQISLGRTLGGATVALFQGAVVFVVCVIAGFRLQRAVLLPMAFVFMMLIAIFFTALGTAIGSVLEDMQGFPLVMNFLVMPLFFFSNALFPIAGLPKVLQFFIRLNPLSYGVDGLRGSLGRAFVFGLGFDFIALGLLTAILVGVGTYFFSKIQV